MTRIGSLFSGYGGLDMAVQEVLGGEVVWYSEIDKAACQVLAAHHPGVPNLGDITNVDWAAVPPVDILTGGYPCQPFSHAGQRKGTNDERHLWPHVRDAIAALRPMVAVFENVDGHRSLGLADVLGDLADLGLSVRWGVVRAADAGAPHGRKRVFIVADADSARLQGHLCGSGETSTDGRGHALAGAALPADATDLRHQWGGDARGWRAGPEDSGESAADPEGRRRGTRAGLATAETGRGEPRVGDGGGAAAADADRERHGRGQGPGVVGRVGSAPDVLGRKASAARSESGAGGDTPAIEWGKYGPAIHRWERITRPAPAPTVPGVNGRPRLSPYFVEWMMGLSEGHVTGHGLRPATCLKMLGNGVVPQQAALALRMLLDGAA